MTKMDVVGELTEKRKLIDWLEKQDDEFIANVLEGKEGIAVSHTDGRAVYLVAHKIGEWKYNPDGVDWGLPAWCCSVCGSKNDMLPTHIQTKSGWVRENNPYHWAGSHYCPCCGARMVPGNE